MPTTVVHKQCTLCEAHCGINVEVDGDRVLRITGDPDDVFSKGYICPKAAALRDLHEDVDRLRRPVKRVGDGWQEIGWEEALDLAAEGLRRVQDSYGRNAVATYLGNPGAHSMSVLSILPLRQVLGTHNNYSATSTDQLPQHLTCGEMLGNVALFPVPDVDRTDHMLVIGANPSVSNGSLMTAPGARHRLRGDRRARRPRGRDRSAPDRDGRARLRARGRAARAAIRSCCWGCCTWSSRRIAWRWGGWRRSWTGSTRSATLAAEWTPERVAPLAGVEAADIARLALDFAAAPRAVAYGRVGVCQTETGLADALADQRAQHRDGELRPRGRRHVPDAARRPGAGAALRRADGLRQVRPLHPAGFRFAGDERRAAGGGARRRDPDARRRPGARDALLRRQPGPVDARRRPAGHGDGVARVLRRGRHVRDRDDAPRRRDPAAGLAHGAQRRRHRHAGRVGAQPRPLQPARRAQAGRGQGGLGDPQRR